MNSLTVFNREYNGRTIRQREDGYISLTDMAQACNKDYYEWSRLPKTKSYLDTLSQYQHTELSRSLIETVKDGAMDFRGTWGHRKVAIRFAQWCDDDFAIQVDTWIEELLLTGKVSIIPEELELNQDSSDLRVEELENEVYDLKKRLTHIEEYLVNLPKIQIPQFKVIDETFELKHKESLAMYYEMLETCKTVCQKRGKDSLMTSDLIGCSILKRKKFLVKYGKSVKNIKVLNKPQLITIFLEMQEEGLGTWKYNRFYPNLEKLNTLVEV